MVGGDVPAVTKEAAEVRTQDGEPAAVRRREPDPGDEAVDDLDVAGDEQALDHRRLDSESRRASVHGGEV